MKQYRKYGNPPFSVAVIHGGPGARGEMAPVGCELSSEQGVLEPLQSKTSIEGLVSELRDILDQAGYPPIILIGFSWGAWLGFMYAARYPRFIKKLILIGCGGFREEHAAQTLGTRLSRLTSTERTEVTSLINKLNDPEVRGDGAIYARIGSIFSKADAYDPIISPDKEMKSIDFKDHIFKPVWKEAEKMRSNGDLLRLGKSIQCPVIAIHGDWDPHPARGVWEPLNGVLKDFRFIPIERCGHKPWIEREARDYFFEVLKEELSS